MRLHAFNGIVEPVGDSLRFERRLLDDRGITSSGRGETRMIPRDSVVSVEGAFFSSRPLLIGIMVTGGLIGLLFYTFMPFSSKPL